MMLTTTTVDPGERRLSAVDVFCLQTYQPSGPDPVRRARGFAYGLGAACAVLVVALGLTAWRANAMEQERNVLARELRLAHAAQAETALAARDIEMKAANDALETTVRRDIVDERMLQQEQRSLELAQLAARVEQEKLVKADCVTPRSILRASGL